ncbi:phosphonate ABC transporter substrate-binding protein [Afifella marina DSM 2698]|nr:phosphonate ABC transporter substrate-binding protein [Afifella marina DSM 2698]MBK1625968.1 phosphonate ABC transporter substrate-binding protein [Afifella marina]MBK5917792.1 phosphonate ABC transporter substrate-binding protein [Afifella marina]RAI23754.1 phosphonate ABC transporter substrate-binding protein [Afifella marina DSM 2698]
MLSHEAKQGDISVTYKLLAGVAALAVGAAFSAGAANAQSRDTIQIAGSSTVLPFASIVAEEFGNAYPDFNTPVVGSGGSSGGLRQFCQGVGENTIDIANASRRIKPSEIEACNEAGVKKIIEVRIGYDGIVFATNADKDNFALKPIDVYKALAAKVPQDGKMVDNPYTSWSDIDSSLPDQEIQLAIPAGNHGTREVFEEKVVLPGCEEAGLPEMSEDEMKATCLNFRQDRVTEISGDYTETLARLEANDNTMGVFGLSFYDQNRDKLKVATMSGVEPSIDTIASGDYPVSRPLFFYIKGEHIGVIPGIKDYAEFFLSDDMAGSGGRLEEAGMIPAPEKELETQRQNVEDEKTLSASDLQG